MSHKGEHMASLTLTVPDSSVNRILTAFEYTPDKGDVSVYMKEQILNLIKSKVVQYETDSYVPPEPPVVDITTLNLS